MQDPEVTIVTFRPDVVHTDVVDEEMTGMTPDVAVGATANGVADQVRVPGFVNEMVFETF